MYIVYIHEHKIVCVKSMVCRLLCASSNSNKKPTEREKKNGKENAEEQ